ncbi:hypothetical protein JOL79_06890 [Microbispora sp. RL4-1S]|uniref:Uncharacterized protein n=1 Tax=Microbispora oryzae TaxID=2806554 RepID=A0A940WMU6_9ACTN|nr:hypothetical protein [Microbispora oryzae]MBP2703524.1 hypothetical protein [Microbispora oryzae]
MADVTALPLAEALLACLCAELDDTVAGPVCVCCLAPGPEPADCCTCPGGEGRAWVRVTRIFPTSARFPLPAVDPGRCATDGSYAVELELGVYRCVATIDDDGTPPSCDQRTADAVKLLDDAAAMRRAVSCCFPRTELGRGRAVVVGEWRPIAPEGGCAGGALLVTVESGDCCPPAGGGG